MNRPRREDETFEEYRANQKREGKELDDYLHKQKPIWTSAIIVPDAKDKHLLPMLRNLVKLKVRGTFCRRKGHTMPNSMYERNKRDRIIRDLEKEGIIQ